MFPTSKNKPRENSSKFEYKIKEVEILQLASVEKPDVLFDETTTNAFYKYINGGSDSENDINQETSTKTKTYIYDALNSLNKDEPMVEKKTNIFICAYNVNTYAKLPFIQFAMNKFDQFVFEDMLTLPCFSYFGKDSVINECVEKLNNLLVYDGIKDDYKYEGHIFEDEDLYIFFEIASLTNEVAELYRKDRLWFVISDEIVNYKSVCNFPIHDNVVDFFLRNYEFLLLQDENGENIESPIICYKGVHEDKLKFTSVFGVSKSDNDGIVGPYYYFTTYEKAIEQGGWSSNKKEEFRHGKKITENNNGKYDNGGIVRFALILGSMKVPLNYPEDETDLSLYKKTTILEERKQIDRHTMRITDYDGNWTEKFDSIYIGNLELDDGSQLMDAPYWVVKEYEQQVPLSFHYINKGTLGDVWEKRDDYYIK